MKIDSVIFDMDGVLVDVNRSYRIAIEKTANFLLERKGFPGSGTQKEVSMIKNLPGFNNDWDATYVLILLLSEGVKREKFAKTVKTLQPINKLSEEYKEIQDVFQAYYLGNVLFKKIEKHDPQVNIVKGLINQEKCLVSKKFLEKLLKMKIRLGIVTGRPRKEALFALRNFNLQEFFPEKYVIALEDVKMEKPHPESLLKIIKRMAIQTPVYVGDTINDAIAAKRAKIPCIFIGSEKLGDMQISDVNILEEILL